MTPAQQAALSAIRALTINGVSPSYDEIRERLELASKSEVFRVLGTLERDGFITRNPKSARSIKIIEGPTREQMTRWSSAELNRVRTLAFEILDDRLDQPAGAGMRRVSA